MINLSCMYTIKKVERRGILLEFVPTKDVVNGVIKKEDGSIVVCPINDIRIP